MTAQCPRVNVSNELADLTKIRKKKKKPVEEKCLEFYIYFLMNCFQFQGYILLKKKKKQLSATAQLTWNDMKCALFGYTAELVCKGNLEGIHWEAFYWWNWFSGRAKQCLSFPLNLPCWHSRPVGVHCHVWTVVWQCARWLCECMY